MEDNQNYLYYDDEQIPELEVKRKLANDVDQFVANQPWSSKKKQRFMSAYSDIMSKGIKGVSINNGFYTTSVNGDIDLNSLSDKDRDAYELVSGFIQREMKSLKKSSKKTEEKKDLKVLTNSDFVSGLHDFISRDRFGGQDWHIGGEQDQWNLLDERNDKGIRSTNKRAEVLADALQRYSDTIDETKYNFEGSPFNDYSDFKTRVNTAINSLRDNKWDQNDIDALNRIGLNYKDYFNDGSGDSFKKDDYEGTYGDYYNNYLPNKQQAEQKQKDEKFSQYLQQIRNTPKPQYRIMKTQLKNRNLPTIRQLADKYGSTDNLLNQIIEYGNKGLDNLTSEETNELIAAFKNGATKNISKEEHNILKSFPSLKNSPIGRFKKFAQIDNLILDTSTGQVINIYDQATKDAKDADFLAGQSSADLQQQEQQRRIFGEKGLSGADIADISAALIDAVGVGATFVPVVGNVLSAGTGLAGSLTHFGADIARDGLDWGDAGRLALNAGFDLATLIPGLGTAAKAGKLAKAIGKWVPGIIASIGAIQGLSNGKEIINSFGKLAHPSTVTVEDLQNISQGIALLAGGVNVGRGYKQSRKFKNGVEAQEATVTTQKGQKVKLNEQEYNTINSKNATREAKQQALESAVQRHNTNNPSQKIDLTNDGLVYKGRSVTHPLRTTEKSTDVDLLTAPIQGRASRVDFAKLRREDIRNLAQHKWKTRVLPGKTLEQKLNWTNNGMFMRGYHFNNSSTENPAISSSSSPAISSSSSPASTTPVSPKTREVFDDFTATGKSPAVPKHNMTRSEWKKANKKLYNDIDKKGRFTNNMPEEGIYEFKDPIGNTHTFRLIQRDDDFLLDIKSSNGTSKQAVLSLDQVKKGIWDNIKQSLNSTGLRHDISLPANIIRALQGTAYGWLKHGGRINRQKIQQYKEFIKR